ncbi:hypothetical protein [Actinoplanes philippinensis]
MDPGGDEALLRSIAAGDAAALSRLYERHAGPLWSRPWRTVT